MTENVQLPRGRRADSDQIAVVAAMDMDRAYQNGAFIPGAEGYVPRWTAAAAAFRDRLGARSRTGLAYGPGARQALDLFLPESAPCGVVVFVHGGYWHLFGREIWSHLAAGPLARGWAVAMPSYTLAPEARIAAMTVEVGQAVAHAAALVPGPVVVTGHSAGGHLAARMACADAPLPGGLAARVIRTVPISPLSDLSPLRETQMNATLHLDAAEAVAESPALLQRRSGCAVTIWVGGQERPAFLWQARLLSEAWDCTWHVEPGRHHFDIIDALADPDSALTRKIAAAS
jgi:acetyl esterase/lipase